MPRPVGKFNYTPEDAARILMERAFLGSDVKAAKNLRDSGLYPKLGATTVAVMRERHADMWARICATHEEKILEYVAAEMESNVRKAGSLVGDILDKTKKANDADEIPARDLTTAGRNVAVMIGIMQDKVVNPARGRATSVVEHRSAEAIDAELTAKLRKLGKLDEEIVDAEVVEEKTEEAKPPRSLPAGD